MSTVKTNRQRGAVSIFIVVFTALLITVITVSFVRIMIRDQQRATDFDLSQSAYDSAMAGVEDAKRALSRYYDNPTSAVQSVLTSGRCSTVAEIVNGAAPNVAETIIRTDATNDATLNQAYTCVTIELNTQDYLGTLAADEQKIIPLRSAGASTFSKVRIEWFSNDDLTDETTTFSVANADSANSLLPQAEWPQNRPPIMEVQFMQYAQGQLRLSNFDQNGSGSNAGKSNSNTLFLYPSRLAGSTPTAGVAFINDARRSASNDAPRAVKCVENPGTVSGWGNYSCRVDVDVPEPISGSPSNRDAYLRVVPRYNGVHYRLSLISGTSVVPLDGVQPLVDSTGRANDLFRRVEARVEHGLPLPVPTAAVDTTRSFCKVFTVTDNPSIYYPRTEICNSRL